MRSRLALVLALSLGLPGAAAAQGFGRPSGFVVDNPVIRHMFALGMDSSQIQHFGQVLFDSLGPRLTASPGMDAAQNWMVQQYQAMGITARREQYGTWRGWKRGPSRIDMEAPRFKDLEGITVAWSPGTPRGAKVRGDAIVLPDVADSNALVQWLPQARGKFVLVSFPPVTCRDDSSWAHHATPESFAAMKAQRDTLQRAWNLRLQHTGYPGGLANGNIARRLDQAGVAGVITNTWTGALGTDRVFTAITERAPVFDVSCEDYTLLYRLATNHEGPVVEAQAESQNLGEVPVFNVIGEIRGSELPNEYVVLSAHFDSFDGGSGATDNGTGTITMLEAMRILKAAYPNPRRTIVVGHWSAEEMGLIGSHAWAADHPEVISGLQAVFNQDNGTGRVISMSSSGLVNASANVARWLSNFPADVTREIKFSFPGSPAGGGSDHASFLCYGAPAFEVGSENFDYFSYTWHTQRDTYDKLDWDDLRNNATLVAMLAYEASEDPQRVPRDQRTVFPVGRGGQAGSWPTCPPPQRTTPNPVQR